MGKKLPRVSDAELAVLKLLWERDVVTARQVRDVLYPGGTPSDHGTVQKLLQRLEAKRLVARDRSGFAHKFRARVSRDELLGSELRQLAEKMADGSLVPLITQAVSAEKLSAEERRALRRLLDSK